MQKRTFGFSASIIVLGLISSACWAAPIDMKALGFEQLEVPPLEVEPQKGPDTPVEFQFAKLLDVHHALTLLPQLKEAQENQLDRKEQYEANVKRMKALRDCNIKRLSDQFKNPAATWDKITQTYDQREKDLSIYINSAEPSKPRDLSAKTDIGAYSDEEISEMLVHWSLGNDIMTEVYANQDKWGERKAPKSPSFPLWKDQQYLYDQQWDSFYTKVNTFFGVPPQGRPIITDIKYDYNRADDVLMAHKAYIAKLSAKNPEKALLLPDALKKGPAIAPRPLPPARESVLYMGDVEKTQQVFPAWPEPWKKQIENNFQNFNVKGELARDFVAKSFRLKDEVTQEGPDKQNNRLNVYQLQKKEVDGSAKLLEVAELDVYETQKYIQTEIDRNNVQTSTKIDATDPKSYAALQKKLQDEQTRLIKTIEKDLKGSYQEDTIRQVIGAIQKDTLGTTYITTSNATNIDQMLLETAAANALRKEQRMQKKEQQKKKEKPIDEMCLNGGL